MKNLNTFSQFINESKSSALDNYKKLLQGHDWYYELVDDHRSWQAGNKQVDEILDAYRKLSPEEKESAYEFWLDLYKKHYPKSTRFIEFDEFRGYY